MAPPITLRTIVPSCSVPGVPWRASRSESEREPGEIHEDGDGVLREPAVTRRERGMARGARQEWLQSFHRRLVVAR